MAMENIYSPVEFPYQINLTPKMLHKGIYTEIETAIKTRLEGNCMPGIGYIKKGTVQIVKKQLGKCEGSHFTGNISFSLQIRCQSAQPYIGQIISCMVVGKNDMGVLAANYQLPAYTMFIMKMPDDTSGTLDRLQRNNYITVRVLAFQLKAANNIERTKADYWLVCELANASSDEQRYQVLPPIAKNPTVLPIYKGQNIATINSKRSELSRGIYITLEETKDAIQTIRDDYSAMIAEGHAKQDIFLKSLARRNSKYILAKPESVVAEADGKTYTHRVRVVDGNIKTASSVNIKVEADGDGEEDDLVGTLILYYALEQLPAGDYRGRYVVPNFWDRHVKYIINEAEMVHANGQYINQLKELLNLQNAKRSDAESSARVTAYTHPDGKPLAKLIRKDDHVINRAYFKMREMIRVFGIEVFPRESMTIACIAESPGGFIQALLDQRVYNPDSGVVINTGIRDNISSISIPASEPAWSRLAKILTKYKYVNLRIQGADELPDEDPSKTNVTLVGGVSDKEDASGNILDKAIRDSFCQKFSDNKAHLVTADGGFEHDKTENTEEMDTHPLLLAEIIIALRCQREDGTFIIKIYDMATEFTINLLEILCYCYDEVGLFKPSTSRAASSEKYLVCKRLKLSDADSKAIITNLEAILERRPDEGSYYGAIIAVPDAKLKEACVNYNSLYMKKQIGFIESGRNYALLYNKAIRSGNVEEMIYKIIGKIGLQTATAEAFADTI